MKRRAFRLAPCRTAAQGRRELTGLQANSPREANLSYAVIRLATPAVAPLPANTNCGSYLSQAACISGIVGFPPSTARFQSRHSATATTRHDSGWLCGPNRSRLNRRRPAAAIAPTASRRLVLWIPLTCPATLNTWRACCGFTVARKPINGPAHKDPDMEAKLTAELPGILAWAITGCIAWQRDGLKSPAAVADATANYQAEMDVLAAWLGECCIVGKRYEVKAADLYRSYVGWCEQSGEFPEKQRKLGMRLTERGFERFSNNGAWWRGVGLQSDRTERTERTEPENAIFSPLEFSKTSYGKTAFNGSVGSVGSVNQPPPPVEPSFEGRDVEEF